MTAKQNVTSLADLIPDDRNANQGTVRGRGHIETSMRKFGFLEPGVLDRHNHIVAGNNRTEIAAELGMDDPIIIESDGTRPIYVRQLHLDLNTPEGREAAVALNRSAQTSISFDADVLRELTEEGVDLSSFFFDDELAALLNQTASETVDPGVTEAPAPEKEEPGRDSPVSEEDRQIIDQARQSGAKPIFVTPEQRRKIEEAIEQVRCFNDAETQTEGDCLALIVEEWLASNQ